MNKKGIAPIAALGIIILVGGLIAIGAFVFSGTLRWTLIGIGIIIGAFWLMGQALQSSTFNQKKIFPIIVIALIGVSFIAFAGLQQQAFSIDRIDIEGGKGVWLITGSADAEDGYDLIKSPSSLGVAEFGDGSGREFRPQDSLRLRFKEEESYCQYTLIPESYDPGIFTPEISYKVLSNPTRVINVRVTDLNTGISQIIGAAQGSIITFGKDGGQAIVKNNGYSLGQVDCPSNVNVAVANDGTIVYEDDLKEFAEGANFFGSIIDFLNRGEIRENSQFTNSFENSNFQVTDNSVRGDLDIGNVLYTVTADSDYFDSVLYSPPKRVDPVIEDITFPREIATGEITGMKVDIRNREDSSGEIVITTSSSSESIFPPSRTISITDKKSTSFSVSSLNNEGNGRINVKVCEVSTINTPNCDEDSVSYTRVSPEEEDVAFCGDGICQSNENNLQCPQDCTEEDEEDEEDEELECSWYQTKGILEEKDYGAFYWRALVPGVDAKITQTAVCKTAGWVYGLITGIVILILGAYAIRLYRPSKLKRTGKRK